MALLPPPRWSNRRYHTCIRQAILLLTFLLYVVDAASLTDTNTATDTTSLSHWIPHLESSFAASSAQATTVAVSALWTKGEEGNEDCVVLLCRTPRSTSTSDCDVLMQEEPTLSTCNDELITAMGGLRLLENQQARENEKFLILGANDDSSAVVCMTGFVPDILHLRLVLLKHVHSHYALYSTHAISSWKLLHFVSTYVDRATRIQGARPWGVQMLMVMAQQQHQELSDGKNHNRLALYTIDPSGTWKRAVAKSNTRVTAVVGRDAHSIHEWLTKNSNDEESLSPRAALVLAMRALVKQQVVSRAGEYHPSDDTASYEGRIVWPSSSEACQTATIHSDDVSKCHEDVLKELLSEK